MLMKKGKIVYVNDITAHCQKLEEISVIAGIKHKSETRRNFSYSWYKAQVHFINPSFLP